MIIVASAKALAALRDVIIPQVSDILRGKVCKDLVKEPLEKMTAHLAE